MTMKHAWQGARGVAGALALVAPLLLAAASAGAQSPDTANGGIASADTGSGTITFGDVQTGQNVGNVMNVGDIVNSDASLNGGEVSYPTIMYVTVPSGDPTANASGGDDSTIGETEPDTIIVRGDRERDEVNVKNTNTNTNSNQNNNNNTATGGAGGDGGDANVIVSPEPEG
ncbi:MAG: hypothetical protein QM692_17830 [Thermomicrobiales bacterium]